LSSAAGRIRTQLRRKRNCVKGSRTSHNAAPLDRYYFIYQVFDGGAPVGHNDHGFSIKKRPDIPEDACFCFFVKITCAFVEEHDLLLKVLETEQSLSDCDALSLAADVFPSARI
jgi:hypothetical protein